MLKDKVKVVSIISLFQYFNINFSHIYLNSISSCIFHAPKVLINDVQ